MSVADKYTNVKLGCNDFNQNIGELKAMYPI